MRIGLNALAGIVMSSTLLMALPAAANDLLAQSNNLNQKGELKYKPDVQVDNTISATPGCTLYDRPAAQGHSWRFKVTRRDNNDGKKSSYGELNISAEAAANFQSIRCTGPKNEMPCKANLYPQRNFQGPVRVIRSSGGAVNLNAPPNATIRSIQITCGYAATR